MAVSDIELPVANRRIGESANDEALMDCFSFQSFICRRAPCCCFFLAAVLEGSAILLRQLQARHISEGGAPRHPRGT